MEREDNNFLYVIFKTMIVIVPYLYDCKNLAYYGMGLLLSFLMSSISVC